MAQRNREGRDAGDIIEGMEPSSPRDDDASDVGESGCEGRSTRGGPDEMWAGSLQSSTGEGKNSSMAEVGQAAFSCRTISR